MKKQPKDGSDLWWGAFRQAHKLNGGDGLAAVKAATALFPDGEPTTKVTSFNFDGQLVPHGYLFPRYLVAVTKNMILSTQPVDYLGPGNVVYTQQEVDDAKRLQEDYVLAEARRIQQARGLYEPS